jgi:hypothetical protein
MRAVIDTSSLLSLVRYYLPFDKNAVLFNHIKSKIASGEMIILDAVMEECKYISQKLVLNNLAYLNDKEFLKENRVPEKTEDLLPIAPAKFLNMLKNQFALPSQLKGLTEAEFEAQKSRFMESADAKLIMFCQHLIKDLPKEEIYLVTEETSAANDLKLFKKIPAICQILDIPVISLPGLLEKFPEVDLGFGESR